MIVASFVFFLILFVGIGLAAVKRAEPSRHDYYLASRSVSPLFTGLSAVATNTKTLHRFVDEIQQGLSRIDHQIRATYFS